MSIQAISGHKREGALKGIDSDTDTDMILQARVKVYTMQRQQNVSAKFFEEGV